LVESVYDNSLLILKQTVGNGERFIPRPL
jgi:hypothetical protein